MDDERELELTAWDVEVLLLPDVEDVTLSAKRDIVIERWLMVSGDTRPFLDWVLRVRHEPCRRIVEIVAQMMAKSANVELPPDWIPPFGLMVDRTGQIGEPKNLEAEVRNFCLGAISDAKIDSKMPPGAADLATQKYAKIAGFDGVGLATVEKARKDRRKHLGKYLRKRSSRKGKRVGDSFT